MLYVVDSGGPPNSHKATIAAVLAAGNRATGSTDVVFDSGHPRYATFTAGDTIAPGDLVWLDFSYVYPLSFYGWQADEGSTQEAVATGFLGVAYNAAPAGQDVLVDVGSESFYRVTIPGWSAQAGSLVAASVLNLDPDFYIFNQTVDPTTSVSRSIGQPRSFAPIRDVPNKYAGLRRAMRVRNPDGSFRRVAVTTIKPYRQRGPVWPYTAGSSNTTSDREAFGHPALMPERLARDLIVSWSRVGARSPLLLLTLPTAARQQPPEALLFDSRGVSSPFAPSFAHPLHFRHRKSDTGGWKRTTPEKWNMTEAHSLGTWESDPLGTFGHRLRSRLAPGQGERPGRPSDPTWTVQRKLSMNAETLTALERIAESLSTNERRVSPMQVAALLVEDATERLQGELIEH